MPALAAVISFIDVRDNLQIVNSNSRFKRLWIQIFLQCYKLGLNFEQLTNQRDANAAMSVSWSAKHLNIYLYVSTMLGECLNAHGIAGFIFRDCLDPTRYVKLVMDTNSLECASLSHGW